MEGAVRADEHEGEEGGLGFAVLAAGNVFFSDLCFRLQVLGTFVVHRGRTPNVWKTLSLRHT